MVAHQGVLWHCQSLQDWDMWKKESRLSSIDENEEDAATYYILTIKSGCGLSTASSTKAVLYS